MAFNSEREMVETIKNSNYLKDFSNSGPCLIKEEVTGFFGVPDLIVIRKTPKKHITYAYEAKLTNWKRALYQAFRYKAFVNRSYVIMDHDRVKAAVSHSERFERANIGLISIDNSGKVYHHYRPRNEAPYSSQLESKFNNIISSCELDA